MNCRGVVGLRILMRNLLKYPNYSKMNQGHVMEYRNLGNTGLKISVISYGNWLNAHSPDAVERSFKCIKKAWDLGINFFDTAEIYGSGEAEK